MYNKQNIAVLDCLLGDNAKGKLAHYFSKKAQFTIRVFGSSNCGHMIYRNNKKYVHHLLPSADYRYNVKSFLANTMMINPDELLQEIKEASIDYPHIPSTIYVDPDAFVITDEHIRIDKEQNSHLGTTGKGVGPATVDKYARRGTRFYNLINDNAEVIRALQNLGVNFKTVLELREEFENSSLVFEGNQGVALDLNHGISYPYCTASDCTVSGIYTAGFHFVKLDRVYGMLKPYLTKSGTGPMPTEYFGQKAEQLQITGKEIGNSTGRKRRIGALDLPMLKYGVQKGGMTHLIIAKMDILDGQNEVEVCNSYGKELYSPNDFKDAKPQYINLPGWKDGKDPKQIKPFVSYIENYVGKPVEYISSGINDEDIIKLRD